MFFFAGQAAALQPPLIISSLTDSATVGQPYSYTIVATGDLPMTFAAAQLPSGLSASGATISGTPTIAELAQISITATNDFGSDTETLTLNITSPPAGQAPIITSPLNVSAAVGSQFSYAITATGATPITFSTSTLPANLQLNGAVISGIPAAPGTSSITLNAVNDFGSTSSTLLLDVSQRTEGPPAIDSRLTATAAVGEPFTYTPLAAGAPPIGFTVTGLPPGLKFNGTAITGTPTKAGTTNVTLTADNTLGTDTRTLVITVTPSGPQLNGTWSGRATAKRMASKGRFRQTNEVRTANVIFTQTEDTLSATITFSGKSGSREFSASGSIANGEFSLSGATAAADATLTMTGNLGKNGRLVRGDAVVQDAAGPQRITFTLRQQH
jgi:hypothetical protein